MSRFTVEEKAARCVISQSLFSVQALNSTGGASPSSFEFFDASQRKMVVKPGEQESIVEIVLMLKI